MDQLIQLCSFVLLILKIAILYYQLKKISE
jgi:hypothetical protein